MKIGYQGTLGSFSQIASKELFPNDELVNYLTFNDVILNVINGELDYGVLPIENSYTGEVSMVLDELYHNDAFIVKMYNLPIIQNLVGLNEAKLEEIEQVYSHEQALMQCSNFLKEIKVEMISYSNTAMASKYIKEANDPKKAAIASSLTAQLYGLKVLKSEINNNKSNTTRFAIISKELKEINNHFAFMFTVKDGSGALANILNEISKLDINLTAISSHSTHEAWKYYFYCEAEGRLDSENVLKLQTILIEKCQTFKVIGSY